MSAEFARVITQEVATGNLRMDFRGVALGDSWISAMDYVNTWGEYLYANVSLQFATGQNCSIFYTPGEIFDVDLYPFLYQV
ncbi:unnamed protein product [Heligmosomoides polygyrus]|uniref:Hydantoinase_B domain-containing protein n=1 Tax=Heligmosomoides polygyrus TaxID=6339 RepID=A0A183FCC6_HELPZ|nr:unnamed protein product [Heligmosomoides polygyrus]